MALRQSLYKQTLLTSLHLPLIFPSIFFLQLVTLALKPLFPHFVTSLQNYSSLLRYYVSTSSNHFLQLLTEFSHVYTQCAPE